MVKIKNLLPKFFITFFLLLIPLVIFINSTSAQPNQKPHEGWSLHIDAKRHFPSKPDLIAHHYCKTISPQLTECQLYDSDDPNAKLVGVEVVVDTKTYNSFDKDEQALWHYHKTEIPKVDAKLPDLSAEEAAKVVKSLEETYGKIYLLWDPGKGDMPVGEPEVNVLDSTDDVTETQQEGRIYDIKFLNHIQMGLPEQDVYVEKKGSPLNQVFRLEGKEATDPANLSRYVFSANKTIEHDPFKIGKDPFGPFPKGYRLGMTLGYWLGATGTGSYTVTGDQAEMSLSFAKLIPNGVYTVWCSQVTFPPNVKIEDMPCGKEDGSENVFRADVKGNGSFKLKLKPLPESSAETASVIALAYHSNRRTYGKNPGNFGLNSHVQLAYLLPSPTPTATPVVVALARGGVSRGIIVLIIIAVAGGIWYWRKRMGGI